MLQELLEVFLKKNLLSMFRLLKQKKPEQEEKPAQVVKKVKQFLSNFIGFVIVILLAYVAEILNTDYGFWGVIVVFMFYVLKGKKLVTALTFFALCVIKYLPELILSNFHIIYISLALCTFLPIIFINEYNGKQGIKVKYLLYIFYPLHLLLLYLLF